MTHRVDKFADIEILRFHVDGWDRLPLQRKLYAYFLSQATLWGRDILFDQNNRYNLFLRSLLRDLLALPQAKEQHAGYDSLLEYYKQVLFASGFHHHYSEKKFVPRFRKSYFEDLLSLLPPEKWTQWNAQGFTKEVALRIVFDSTFMPIRTSLDASSDVVKNSSVNFYDDSISAQEVEAFYATKHKDDATLSPGLNSKLIKDNGQLREDTYCVEGRYRQAITKIVEALRCAYLYTEHEEEREAILALIQFYTDGGEKSFRDYSLAWLKMVPHKMGVDFINGFIETYQDPLGRKGSWEGLVELYDAEGSERTHKIVERAQWFEDHSPVEKKHKKEHVKGVQASVIEAFMLGGDCYPASPLGINLPNNNSIREQFGSKSITLSNISRAVDDARYTEEYLDAFFLGDSVKESLKQFAAATNDIHTDLHECLGHGSGRLEEGVKEGALLEHEATIEEARADLYALYFIADPKMVELGLLPEQAYQAQYDLYLTNGAIIQLARLQSGDIIQESHMRNRAMIARYLLDHVNDEVMSMLEEGGHYYIRIKDYEVLRVAIGELLKEIQRIKSTGDYEAANDLVNKYGVSVSQKVFQSAKKRFEQLKLSPYKGFLNPLAKIVYGKKDVPKDVLLSYEESYLEQMERYNTHYSTLPENNEENASAKSRVWEAGEWHETLREIRKKLRTAMDGVVAESMRGGGVEHKTNFGVTLPRLKEISKQFVPDKRLADALWYNGDVREFRLLSVLIRPVWTLTFEGALRLAVGVDSLELGEQLSKTLLIQQPYVFELAELLLNAEGLTYFSEIMPFVIATQLFAFTSNKPNDTFIESLNGSIEREIRQMHDKESLDMPKLLYITRCVEKLVDKWPECTQLLHKRLREMEDEAIKANPLWIKLIDLLDYYLNE